jgi:cytochrome c biogenesis protein
MRRLQYPKALKGLSSIRLTAILLLWTAAMCITATILPQHASRPEGAGRSWFFGFTDMFRSIWFILPVLLLALNIAACMTVWFCFMVRRAVPRMPAGCSHEEILPAGTDIDKVREVFISVFCQGWRTKQVQQDSSWLIYGEKNRVRTFIPFVVHTGILLILAGAFLGMLGFKATIEIPVGESSDAAMLGSGVVTRLPFTVGCDDFRVDFYENGMPREYRSDLTFSRNGQVIKKTPVLVNHPVSFEGILISQSGYNTERLATLAVASGSTVRRAVAGESTFFSPDDKRYRVHIIRVVDNVMHMGPAVQLLVETPEGEKPLWVFKEIDRVRARFPDMDERIPEFNPSLIRPYTFTLEKIEARYTTVLGLNKDPGIFFAAAGAVVFLAGILIMFLVPRNRIWFSLEPAGKVFKLKIAHSMGGKICSLDPDILDRLSSLPGGDA